MPIEDDDVEQEFEPLARRLRDMRWPQVEPGTRERCWQDFQRMVAEGRVGEADDRSAAEEG